MFQFLKERSVVLILIGIANLGIVYTYVHTQSLAPGSVVQSPRLHSQDTPTYLDAMHYFAGNAPTDDVTPYLQRMLTSPLLLISGITLGTLIGDYASGLLFLNIGLYLISILIFFCICMLVYNDERVAMIGSILYLTNWVLFSYGPTYLSDMSGWFFFLLATMYALSYYREPTVKKWFYLAAITATVGALFKEYGALGMISLSLLIAIQALPWRQKIRQILIASAIFGGTLAFYHLFYYFQFHYSYFTWYHYNFASYGIGADPATKMYNLVDLVKVLVLIFMVGWPLFFAGAARELKCAYMKNKDRLMILLALLPASLAFLLWPAFFHRVSFILIPWLILIAAFGLARVRSPWLITVILIAYSLVNYHTNTLMTKIALPF